MNLIFVLGTAGSGKSTFTAKFTRFLEYHREDVMAVNLDPGSMILPYAANVDVREYIKVEEIMEEYGLGPNGGLMLAHDMMAGIVEDLSSTGFNVTYVSKPIPISPSSRPWSVSLPQFSGDRFGELSLAGRAYPDLDISFICKRTCGASAPHFSYLPGM